MHGYYLHECRTTFILRTRSKQCLHQWKTTLNLWHHARKKTFLCKRQNTIQQNSFLSKMPIFTSSIFLCGSCGCSQSNCHCSSFDRCMARCTETNTCNHLNTCTDNANEHRRTGFLVVTCWSEKQSPSITPWKVFLPSGLNAGWVIAPWTMMYSWSTSWNMISLNPQALSALK